MKIGTQEMLLWQWSWCVFDNWNSCLVSIIKPNNWLDWPAWTTGLTGRVKQLTWLIGLSLILACRVGSTPRLTYGRQLLHVGNQDKLWLQHRCCNNRHKLIRKRHASWNQTTSNTMVRGGKSKNDNAQIENLFRLTSPDWVSDSQSEELRKTIINNEWQNSGLQPTTIEQYRVALRKWLK